MKGPRKRHRYAERVPLIAQELRRLNRSATRAELFEALKTEPGGLFDKRRQLDATLRWDKKQKGREPVFRPDGRNRIALGSPLPEAEAGIPSEPQESRVYDRGQTVVPKKIRDAMNVQEGSTLVWHVEEGVARVVAIPKDPVRALYGIMKDKGPTFEEYLAERNAERRRERELEADEERRWRTYSTRRR